MVPAGTGLMWLVLVLRLILHKAIKKEIYDEK